MTHTTLIPDAARALQAHGIHLAAKRVREVSRLARSFIDDGMGRTEALDDDAFLLGRLRRFRQPTTPTTLSTPTSPGVAAPLPRLAHRADGATPACST